MDLLPVVLAGLLGTVLGALPWYGIGRADQQERIEPGCNAAAVGLASAPMSWPSRWFSRYGTALVFWGVRCQHSHAISVPAGIEMMPMAPFLVWTTAGSLVWTALLTVAGMV